MTDNQSLRELLEEGLVQARKIKMCPDCETIGIGHASDCEWWAWIRKVETVLINQ